MSSNTSYAIRFDAKSATIKLAGPCEFGKIEQLRDVGDIAFAQTGVETIVVDCAELTFCDSTTLGVFVVWQNRAIDRSIALHFASVPPQMLLALEVTGLKSVFDFYPMAAVTQTRHQD